VSLLSWKRLNGTFLMSSRSHAVPSVESLALISRSCCRCHLQRGFLSQPCWRGRVVVIGGHWSLLSWRHLGRLTCSFRHPRCLQPAGGLLLVPATSLELVAEVHISTCTHLTVTRPPSSAEEPQTQLTLTKTFSPKAVSRDKRRRYGKKGGSRSLF